MESFNYWPFNIFSVARKSCQGHKETTGEAAGKFQAARDRRVRKNRVVVDQMHR